MGRILITQNEVEYCIFALSNDDPAFIKRGLQYLFWEYDKGRCLTASSKKRILPLVVGLYNHSNIKVRRWFYIVVAILKPQDCEKLLIELLTRHETDPENLTWAGAAIYGLLGEVKAKNYFYHNENPLSSDQLELSSLLFSTSNSKILSSEDRLIKLVNAGNSLIIQWLILLYGYRDTSSSNKNIYDINKELIKDLVGHQDPMVSEYAIWSLYYRKENSYRDIKISIPGLLKSPPNVRKWLYQLLGKDDESAHYNVDLIIEGIQTEKDNDAKVGLAKAVSDKYLNGNISERLIKWFVDEEIDSIKLELLKHFITFASKNDDYKEIIIEEGKNNPNLIRYLTGVLTYNKSFQEVIIEPYIDGKKFNIFNGTIFNTGEVMNNTNNTFNFGNVNASGNSFNFGEFNLTNTDFNKIKENKIFKIEEQDEIIKYLSDVQEIVFSNDISNEIKSEIKNYLKELVKELGKDDKLKKPVINGWINKILEKLKSVSTNLPVIVTVIENLNKLQEFIGKIIN